VRSLSAIGRVAAVGAVIAAIVLVGLILFGGAGAGGYKVYARFLNAGQLVKGNPVQVGGVPVGSVKGIEITDDGHARIELSIDGDHAPLRRGTRAEIRQFSQSGLANRYVDLSRTAASSRRTRQSLRSTSTSSSTPSIQRPGAPSRVSSRARRPNGATWPTRRTSASST
jgi:ABC-type transporter Mla subunit MlaD